ncbi:aldo-keto reductase superfamily protein [Sugiyamaella lignohabitans]|uniref:Aldo-keto reductase superfamily protein n=1 Tax=Sugiyamaella lignohabitans TaxID=796027 RepID=A0A167EMI5_9ASCO|nr:aldo-keto reductase superfamily protein [Sugiyamaella lignohabitans]ANB14254.1 aldo-keto reductase superfamily protein [Sugiyamaella lignohabitans]
MSYVLNSGAKIPNVGFGVWEAPQDETSKLVEIALQSGYRHIDTAKCYDNEKESADGIAKFLKENKEVSRKDVFYTSKIWLDEFGYEKAKKAVQKSVDAASSIEYIDLLLLHGPEPPANLRLGAYKALQEAVAEGKVKNIGVSNYAVHHLEELLNWPELKIKPAVNQVEINPWLQRDDIAQFCKKNNILIEAYSPLMRGERLDDPALVALAKKYNKSVAQVLVRWNLQKGFLPLPKSATASRIKSNIDVYDFELSEEDFESLGDINSYFVAGGNWDPTKWE